MIKYKNQNNHTMLYLTEKGTKSLEELKESFLSLKVPEQLLDSHR